MRAFCCSVFILVMSFASLASDSIEAYTENMLSKPGFISVFYDESKDKVYLQISNFSQPMLFQSSLPHGVGSNDIGLDRGQLGKTRLIQFERFGNKVMLKQLNTMYRASADNLAEKASIDQAFADSVIAGFKIVAQSDNSVLIDYTDYLLSDIHGIATRLSGRKQGSFKVDKNRSGVYLSRTKAFEKNTELEALVTFTGKGTGEYIQQVTPDPNSVTVHLHHSFIELPDDNYKKRVFHPFSGYWKHSWQDYSAPIDEPMEQAFIRRHRLLKLDPTAELSEAVEPIVYYLDPGIPEPVMSALKEGALWWDQAFQAAGYKNAFQVKVLPEDADPMDVRYNVINWVHRATRGWSYGSSVVDPRTGEIIKGHVTLGSLRVRQDYLIAIGLTSPFKDGESDTSKQKEMALSRIRQLSAHEVGHTLGIAHNFAASENGRASVMDYPHPKIEIKRGKISLENAYDKGIGEWDIHAIAYGYQDFSDTQDESKALLSLVQSAKEKGLKYKSDADVRRTFQASSDGHLWDNGEDPLEEFKHLMKVRSKALSEFGLNTIDDQQSLSSIENSLVPIYLLHRYQLEPVAKQVAGVHYAYERKGDSTNAQGVKFVDGDIQKKAIDYLIEASAHQNLTLPEELLRLITPPIYAEAQTREQFKGRMGRVFDPISAAESAAAFALDLLLQAERLNRLAYQSSVVDDIPSVRELVQAIFTEHFYKQKQAENNLTQRLQLVALQKVIESVKSESSAPEVKLSVMGELAELQDWLEDSNEWWVGEDEMHYEALERYLTHYLESGEWLLEFKIKPLPPGSPI